MSSAFKNLVGWPPDKPVRYINVLIKVSCAFQPTADYFTTIPGLSLNNLKILTAEFKAYVGIKIALDGHTTDSLDNQWAVF